MMCTMSDGMESPTGPNPDGGGSGVLGNLPRTRPQRPSARRAAARRSAGGKEDADGTPREPTPTTADDAATGAKRASGAGARREPGQRASRNRAGKRAAQDAGRKQRSTAKLDAVPPQGYEADDDAATGAVRPTGGAELVLSAAEIVGELAKAGLSRSERLIKDALSRLPLS